MRMCGTHPKSQNLLRVIIPSAATACEVFIRTSAHLESAHLPIHYSYRNASTGSSLDAFLAG
jgi:hypothetical protein